MRALVIKHDHVSPLGPIEERLGERGYACVNHEVITEETFRNPAVITTFPDPTQFDLIVPMGAIWAVYDVELVGSWVRPELDLLRAADTSGVPVLGICFGGQALAMAHGGDVTASPEPELGWTEVHSDDPATVPPGPWFQWHGDRWHLPPGAREVARNGAASQAFVLRRNLAVQFHPELVLNGLQAWLDLGGAEVARERGYDPDLLVKQTAEREADSRRRAHLLVDGFLDRVAGAPRPQTPGG
jgi:GMP synthase-like glutamine amidotransferase